MTRRRGAGTDHHHHAGTGAGEHGSHHGGAPIDAGAAPDRLRTIVREPAQAAVEYRVGSRIPSNARLYTVPRDLAVEVPTVRWHKYMTVNSRVLLVDPVASVVVGGVAE